MEKYYLEEERNIEILEEALSLIHIYSSPGFCHCPDCRRPENTETIYPIDPSTEKTYPCRKRYICPVPPVICISFLQ